ncbi:hypothetical protein TI39_contig1039g00002 [Zymoseptoria brevis]|uniref:Uncharacterized protein n=1 Tax=Zymoseptoria brevis TaxID=1047168 RepID=A0A0F4GHX2_9PEZI|nr:hypothetical protein TI39_contig1039g00002 [Zymoseptoria brevis]
MAPRARRPAMYNTPAIRTGGMGLLQVEAITNRPLSIQRRHLAASVLRMREIEPDELSSSEWVAFLVMDTRERDRWIADFRQRRRASTSSSSSSGSSPADRGRNSYDKAEEARSEAARNVAPVAPAPTPAVRMDTSAAGSTPFVSLWVRHLEQLEQGESAGASASEYNVRRPRHARRSVDTMDAPPTYDIAVRTGTPPPAYEPRSDDEDSSRSRIRRWADSHLSRP